MKIKDEWSNPTDFSLSFRCTRSDYAESFVRKGAIKFSTPESWVVREQTHGNGAIIELTAKIERL